MLRAVPFHTGKNQKRLAAFCNIDHPKFAYWGQYFFPVVLLVSGAEQR